MMSDLCGRLFPSRSRSVLSALVLTACLATTLAIPVLSARQAGAEQTAQTKKQKAKPNPKSKSQKKKGNRKAKPAPSQPTTKPAEPVDPAKAARRAELVRMATDYLTSWYTRQLNSADWMARAVATISVSRMPTADATETILKRMGADRHPVCRLVAWQATLARAQMLTDAQHQIWLAHTRKMMAANLFHGDLRIGLLEMLGSVPADGLSRTYFQRLFQSTNSLDSADVPTLIAMGQCLRSWADAQTVERMLRFLGNPSTAVRAELVLQAAGADVPWTRTPAAYKKYSNWWRKNKATFSASTPCPGDWKKLKPQYLAEPVKLADFDVLDKKWRQEMELESLQLRSFAFAIALDCSRSMGPELDRLRRDILVMFTAFSEIAREVGIGLTFFAPGGEVKHFPLTDSQSRLKSVVTSMKIFGPAGEEEWAGAIEKAMHANRWPTLAENTARAIVIISDEPIAEAQFRRAMPLAKAGAKNGFKIYGVMVHSLAASKNPLASPLDRTTGGSMYDPNNPLFAKSKRRKGKGKWDHYNQLADATGGRAFDARVPQGGLGLGRAPGAKGTKAKKPPKKPKAGRQVDGMAIAPIYPGGGPTNSILTVVLTDAIGPGHRDRVEPLVKILAAYCQKAAARIPERRTWQSPGRMGPNHQNFD